MGVFERRTAESAIDNLIGILGQLLSESKFEFFSCMSRLVDSKSTYYTGDLLGCDNVSNKLFLVVGTKTSYGVSYSGAPEVRNNLIHKMGREGLFETFTAAMRHPTFEWANCQDTRVWLFAASDVMELVGRGVLREMCVSAMEKMDSLPEATLKREKVMYVTMIMKRFRRILCEKTGSLDDETYFSIWVLKFILKLMDFSSLPLRLLATEIIQDMITYAREHKDNPPQYEVTGAGLNMVNGIYNLTDTSDENNFHPKYAKVTEDGRGIALFRAKQRQAFVWFISELMREGTSSSQDIDFYYNTGTNDTKNSLYSPSSGWEMCKGEMGHHTSPIDPPPIVFAKWGDRKHGGAEEDGIEWWMTKPNQEKEGEEKEESKRSPNQEGEEEEGEFHFITFEERLIRWIRGADIFQRFYGENAHRELVARSTCVLATLGQNQGLRNEDFTLIWESSLRLAEEEVQKELYKVIAENLEYIPESVFLYFMDILEEAIPSHLEEVILFLSILSERSIKRVTVIGKEALRKLRSLLWRLSKNALVKKAKRGNVVNEYLSSTILSMEDADPLLEECVDSLRESLDSSTPFPDHIIDEMEDGYIENIQILKFLLGVVKDVDEYRIVERYCPPKNDIEDSKSSSKEGEVGLFDLITNELFIYATQRSRIYRENGKEIGDVSCSRISERLSLLRFLFGVVNSPGKIRNVMQEEGLSRLWDTLSEPIERNEVAKFFNAAGVSQTDKKLRKLGSAYTVHECYYVYAKLICNDNVDWSTLGYNCWECFVTYFDGLANNRSLSKDCETPPQLGLETLWKIMLSTTNSRISDEVVDKILDTYDALMEYQPEYQDSLLQHLRDYLTNFQTTLPSSNEEKKGEEQEEDESSSSLLDNLRKVERVFHVIERAIQTSNGVSENPAHGGIGNLNNTIVVGKAQNLYTHKSLTGVVSHRYGEEKGSFEFSFSSFDKVEDLRNEVAKKFDHPRNRINLNYNNSYLAKDKLMLKQCGFGAYEEVLVYLTLKDPTPTMSPSTMIGSSTLESLYNDESYLDGDFGETNFNLKHISEVISEDGSYYDTFFQIMDHAQSILVQNSSSSLEDDEEIKNDGGGEEGGGGKSPLEQVCTSIIYRGWEVLLSCPSSRSLLTSIQSALQGGDSDIIWSDFLSMTQYPTKSAYQLQIVDSVVNYEVSEISSIAKNILLENDGLSSVLSVLLFGDSTTSTTITFAETSSLKILRESLFGGEMDDSTSNEIAQKIVGSDTSALLLSKLLKIASSSSSMDTVGDALITTQSVLSLPNMVDHFVGMPSSRQLLMDLLVNGRSTLVREMSKKITIFIGGQNSVVSEWLCDEVDRLSENSTTCLDLFEVIVQLLSPNEEGEGSSEPTVDYKNCTKSITTKLLRLHSLVSFSNLPQGEGEGEPSISSPLSTNSNRSFSLQANNVRTVEVSNEVVSGCLIVLNELVKVCWSLVEKTELGSNLINYLFNEFLFAVPSDENPFITPLCSSSSSRKVAYRVISSAIRFNKAFLNQILGELNSLWTLGSSKFMHSWSLSTAYDHKDSSVSFSGLKNQGCTCYLNSLIQQLFMSIDFRNAILNAPIPQSQRLTISHLTDDQLVGREAQIEWFGGDWVLATIHSINEKGVFELHYPTFEGGVIESCVNLRDARVTSGGEFSSSAFTRETGRVRLLKKGDFERIQGILAASREGESSSSIGTVMKMEKQPFEVGSEMTILEEMQRTFAYLKSTKKRAYNPRSFVNACQALNLSFPVFQQNDASEFCDQLLDRLDTALKSTSSHSLIMNELFSGEIVYQKIPVGCDHKADRNEKFLKVELQIRGKESVQESLEAFVEGEFMFGDNRVMCDECGEKKDTTRRTCFKTLPNLLLVHLKRFDLDFTTFETVKLNSKMDFPTVLNMRKYCKEYLEAEDLKNSNPQNQDGGESESKGDNDQDDEYGESGGTPSGKGKNEEEEEEEEVNEEDYEYDLVGVLVHMGVAQGGHYYSFISKRDTILEEGDGEDGLSTPNKRGDNGSVETKEDEKSVSSTPSDKNKWFRFDDDDVSHFDSANIPTQCFGGEYTYSSSWGDRESTHERVMNALMVVYEKKIRLSGDDIPTQEDVPSTPNKDNEGKETVDDDDVYNMLVTGTDAFEDEVVQSNVEFTLNSHLFDPELHTFLSNLLMMLTVTKKPLVAWMPPSEDGKANEELSIAPSTTFNLSIKFLMDVILHTDERGNLDIWKIILGKYFTIFPETLFWFLTEVNDTWFKSHLLKSKDPQARLVFVDLITTSVNSAMPYLLAEEEGTSDDFNDLLVSELGRLCDGGIEENRYDTDGKSPSDLIAASFDENEELLTSVKGLVILLLRNVVTLIGDVKDYSSNSDELFLLITRLCSLSPIRHAFLNVNLFARLGYFISEDRTPAIIQEKFPDVRSTIRMSSSSSSSSSEKRKVMVDTFSVSEALCALIGVPLPPKANLVKATNSSCKKDMILSSSKYSLYLLFVCLFFS